MKDRNTSRAAAALRRTGKNAEKAAVIPRIRRLGMLVFLVAMLGAAVPAHGKDAAPIPEIGYLDLFRTIGQARGQVVVVNFFASWCPACKEMLPALKTLRRQYPEEALTVLGVSVDEDPGALSALVRASGFNYPVFRAKSGIGDAFQISSIPKTLIYGKKRQLSHNSEGPLSLDEFHRAIDGLLQQ